jgi:hypothetical protein
MISNKTVRVATALSFLLILSTHSGAVHASGRPSPPVKQTPVPPGFRTCSGTAVSRQPTGAGKKRYYPQFTDQFAARRRKWQTTIGFFIA